MIVPQMLDPELVGRSPVECTELRYRTDVGLLGARRQIAHGHILDHALTQRRDRLAHRKLLSIGLHEAQCGQEGICRYPNSDSDEPTNQKRNCGNDHQTPPQADYRGSGLVQWIVMERAGAVSRRSPMNQVIYLVGSRQSVGVSFKAAVSPCSPGRTW